MNAIVVTRLVNMVVLQIATNHAREINQNIVVEFHPMIFI
jgi:hypothetical protein